MSYEFVCSLCLSTTRTYTFVALSFFFRVLCLLRYSSATNLTVLRKSEEGVLLSQTPKAFLTTIVLLITFFTIPDIKCLHLLYGKKEFFGVERGAEFFAGGKSAGGGGGRPGGLRTV
jgi:hypothetical protein